MTRRFAFLLVVLFELGAALGLLGRKHRVL